MYCIRLQDISNYLMQIVHLSLICFSMIKSSFKKIVFSPRSRYNIKTTIGGRILCSKKILWNFFWGSSYIESYTRVLKCCAASFSVCTNTKIIRKYKRYKNLVKFLWDSSYIEKCSDKFAVCTNTKVEKVYIA